MYIFLLMFFFVLSSYVFVFIYLPLACLLVIIYQFQSLCLSDFSLFIIYFHWSISNCSCTIKFKRLFFLETCTFVIHILIRVLINSVVCELIIRNNPFFIYSFFYLKKSHVTCNFTYRLVFSQWCCITPFSWSNQLLSTLMSNVISISFFRLV